MPKDSMPESIRLTLIQIMRDHGLAKFGDTVINFIYSWAKTKCLKTPMGERVYDKALAEAIRQSNLRNVMPSSSSSGDLGDGAEALIGFAFLEELMDLEEMTEIIQEIWETESPQAFSSRKKEKRFMIECFTSLLLEIKERVAKRITNNSS
ncbi:MAG: hypothetical protein GF308_20910 [Candidatus Heimdallarchaeota archaeon]|nr:hypothetical protein [Candidatus Heimdallarchaeota archaeon]